MYIYFTKIEPLDRLKNNHVFNTQDNNSLAVNVDGAFEMRSYSKVSHQKKCPANIDVDFVFLRGRWDVYRNHFVHLYTCLVSSIPP